MASKKKPAVKVKKKAAPKKTKQAAPAAKKKTRRDDFSGPHPKLAVLTKKLPPGRYADGLVLFNEPGTHARELGDWLMGNTKGRVALGRTAFGELIVFRDLRERARENGEPDAHLTCDVAIVDIHTKRMKVPCQSVEEWLASLDDAAWQREHLRRDLYDEVAPVLGAYAADECYGFVPALVLGGAEEAASVQKQKWRAHQALLLQL